MDTQLLELFKSTPTFDSYITITNNHILKLLKSYNNQFIHLIGGSNTGKSHLLKAWVHQKLPQSIYLDSKFDQINAVNIVNDFLYIAIDNIDWLNTDGQTAIFNLFNAIKLNNKNNMLLTSSSVAFDKLSNLRDDVKTRILSGLNITLKALDDNEILQCIQIFVKNESINISEVELNYLINHHTRNMGDIIETINKVAEVSLLKNRNITIPLIKEVINNNLKK